MKRFVLLLFICCSLSAFAQESSFVGEWSCTIKESRAVETKYIFRIEAYDNHYYVRGKTIAIVDSEERSPSYHAPYTVEAVSNNTLVVMQPYSYDYGETYGNGYYTLTFVLKGPYIIATRTLTRKDFKKPGGQLFNEYSGAAQWNLLPYQKIEELELYKNDGW